MAQPKEGCGKPTRGPIAPAATAAAPAAQPAQEVTGMTTRVGKEAPDFEVSAHIGTGFKNIKLSDYKGKRIVLCFYPGDLTYV